MWFPRESRQCEFKALSRSPTARARQPLKDVLGQSSRCSPQSFCSPECRGSPQVLAARARFSAQEPSQESPAPWLLLRGVRCPLLWWAPAPGSRSAQGLGHGSRDQEPSLRVLVPGWVSDLDTCPGGGPSPPASSLGPPQPSPHCPQAPGISRASRRAAGEEHRWVWMAQIEAGAGRSALRPTVFPHPISFLCHPGPPLLLASTSSHSEHGESREHRHGSWG